MSAYASAVCTNIGASGLALYHRTYSCPGNWVPEYIYRKSELTQESKRSRAHVLSSSCRPGHSFSPERQDAITSTSTGGQAGFPQLPFRCPCLATLPIAIGRLSITWSICMMAGLSIISPLHQVYHTLTTMPSPYFVASPGLSDCFGEEM